MNFWYILTLFGSQYSVLSILVILYLVYFFRYRGNKQVKRFVLFFTLSVFLTLFFVYSLKIVTDIPRPCIPCSGHVTECNPYCPDDNSFPSGHSAITFAMAGSVALYFRKRKYLALFILSSLVAISRYMLHVHTIIDISAGMALGVAVPYALSHLMIYKHPQ